MKIKRNRNSRAHFNIQIYCGAGKLCNLTLIINVHLTDYTFLLINGIAVRLKHLSIFYNEMSSDAIWLSFQQRTKHVMKEISVRLK